MLARVEEIIDRAIQRACVFTLWALFALLLIQVITRYFALAAITWTDEVIELLFVWLSFAGAARLVRHWSHLHVDVLDRLLSYRGQGLLGALRICAAIPFMVLLTISGALLVKDSNSRLSPILNLPYSLWYLAIPVSGVVMIFYAVRRLWNRSILKSIHSADNTV